MMRGSEGRCTGQEGIRGLFITLLDNVSKLETKPGVASRSRSCGRVAQGGNLYLVGAVFSFVALQVSCASVCTDQVSPRG
jgi:hypothetical protein